MSDTKWHLACTLRDLEGGPCEVLVEQRVIAVFRTDDGYWAVDGMCAHQGGPLAKGSVDGCCVTCPWHGWQYDITNGHNVLTGRPMLTTYKTEIRGQEVWLEVP